ncbi:hypothetical protein HZ994_14225 [Akkermansiaceae bacterium]|nr:hypothetical protein HZ994_14225 [Akkermansiaceae bacterium]
MKFHTFPLAAICSLSLCSCFTSRTPFSPGGSTTVGMPEKLSERERGFVPEIDTALRREGLVPVRSGKGELQLDFTMSEGPVNTTTRIGLSEGEETILAAEGRAAGIPLIGRDGVARKSFDAAFSDFDAKLTTEAPRRGWSRSGETASPTSPAAAYQHDIEPVY